jgi:hypothetical protein
MLMLLASTLMLLHFDLIMKNALVWGVFDLELCAECVGNGVGDEFFE